MYPTLSDLLKDLFGLNIPLPIQTFGFFVAVSFLAAAYTLSLELHRKQSLGLLKPVSREVWKGKRSTPAELFFSAFIGFLIGFKGLYFIFNYHELVDDPQKALLSLNGSLPGGIVAGIGSVWLRYRDAEMQKKEQPELVTETVPPSDLVSNFTMVAAIAGIIGAKIFDILEHPAGFLRDPVGTFFSFSGLTMYGGLIVGAIAVLWYGVKQQVSPVHLSDAAAPGLMLAYGTGRIGCQLSGDGDWGITNIAPKPTSLDFLPDWAWSFNYPHNVINEGIPIQGCMGKHCFMLEQGVFPTPLYESVTCILLFFVLWAVRKKITVPGVMFSLYLLVNGIERFFVEQIRVNSKYHVAGIDFTQAQMISLILIVLGTAGILYFRNVHRKKASLVNE